MLLASLCAIRNTFDFYMTFVFPLLLGSLAFIGIPVLIHLIMRHKPKKAAVSRFSLSHATANGLRMRKLRLRHLVLLALRISWLIA